MRGEEEKKRMENTSHPVGAGGREGGARREVVRDGDSELLAFLSALSAFVFPRPRSR